jgi:FMN phosphatase YigB (HAD superfamily)
MDARSVPEIRDALEALERYDRSNAEYDDAHAFREALESLADYLEDEPGTSHRAFIANVRETYLRRLLEKLDRLKNADDFTVIQHVVILTDTAAADVQRLLDAHPALRPAVDALLARGPGRPA